LPRQYRREKIKHTDRESSCNKKVPICPAKPLHVKVNRSHRAKKGVNSPIGIRLAKTECMSDSKKQQKNRRDSIKDWRFQVLPRECSLRQFITSVIPVWRLLPFRGAYAPPGG